MGALFRGDQGRLRAGWRAALFAVLLVICAGVGLLLATSLALGVAAGGAALRYSAGWSGLAVGALAAHWLMVRFIDRQRWEYVGLHRAAAEAPVLARGFLVGALPITIASAALLAVGWLTVSPVSGGPGVFGVHTLLLLVMFLAAALFEELLLRGYLLSALADGMGRVGAVLATSVAFGLLHLRNPGAGGLAVTVVIVAGIFLAAVRFATGSLYAAWVAHAAWNIVMALVLHTAVSGTNLVPPGGWRVTDTGPDWATGGVWGPEGGVPAATALLVATWYLIRRRPALAGDANVARSRGESVE